MVVSEEPDFQVGIIGGGPAGASMAACLAKAGVSCVVLEGELFPRIPLYAPKAAHALIRADCLEWLREQAKSRQPMSFDLIFCDPPTFSTSKKMEETLDIQRDHVDLLRASMRHLARDGLLLFSNNYRRFRLDEALLAEFDVRDITADTIPPDFARNPKIHQCWEFRHRGGAFHHA